MAGATMGRTIQVSQSSPIGEGVGLRLKGGGGVSNSGDFALAMC